MKEKYQNLLLQVRGLADGETNAVGALTNITAAMRESFPERFFWVGFYVVNPDRTHLLLGPFQGPVACYRIKYGRGVCGTAWERNETIIVEDVEKFPGHIACSSLSRSEIVVPIRSEDGSVVAVLDSDSDRLDTFNETDKEWLEAIVKEIPIDFFTKIAAI